LHFTNQNTTIIYFTVYHCIAYYFSLHIPTAQDFLVPLYLNIYLFSIAYLFLVLYTYTHLVLDNHLVRLRAQSNLFYFTGCQKRDRKDPFTHSSLRVRYKPSSHLHGENQAFLC
jgi:hypothetical protein